VKFFGDFVATLAPARSGIPQVGLFDLCGFVGCSVFGVCSSKIVVYPEKKKKICSL